MAEPQKVVAEQQLWEYHREKGRGLWASPSAERLSELGSQGWELVAVDALNARFYFKRPKQ